MDFHDFERFLGKSWCRSEPTPQVMCRPNVSQSSGACVARVISSTDRVLIVVGLHRTWGVECRLPSRAWEVWGSHEKPWIFIENLRNFIEMYGYS